MPEDPRINLLRHGACADAYHDFGHSNLGFNTSRDKSKPGLYHVAAGIPNAEEKPYGKGHQGGTPDDKLKDEDAIMKMMFPDFEDMGRFVLAIRSACGTEHNCKIGVEKRIGTIKGSVNYKVKTLFKEVKGAFVSDVKLIYNKLTDLDYSNFFEVQGDINLLFDAGNIDIITLLKNASREKVKKDNFPTLHIRRIVNRELINDPAPKTYSEATTHVDQNAKIDFGIMFDVFKEPVCYPKFSGTFDNEDPYQRDKFFSLLDFTLGKLKTNNGALPLIEVEIKQQDGKRIYENNDPHTNNRIASCAARIMKLLKGDATKDHITASAHYQCKRSGDWLQAISCLDTKRIYSDNINLSGAGTPLNGKKIILVTHDRILLWYGLFMGLDVLFTYRVGAESGAEEDSGSESEEDLSRGSEKVLLYFCNPANNNSPDELMEINIDSAVTNYSNIALLRSIVANYNTAVTQIKTQRTEEIGRLYNIIHDKGTPKKKRNEYLALLLQEYIRFTSIDYELITLTSLESLATAFNTVNQRAAATLAEKSNAALAFSTLYDSYLAKFSTLRITTERATPVNEILPKIESFYDSYKSDLFFVNTPVLYTPAPRSEPRANAASPLTPVIKLALFLKEKLPADVLSTLIAQFKAIKTDHFSDPDKYFLDTFIVNLGEPTTKVDIASKVKCIQDEQAEIIANGGAGYKVTKTETTTVTNNGATTAQVEAASSTPPLEPVVNPDDGRAVPLIGTDLTTAVADRQADGNKPVQKAGTVRKILNTIYSFGANLLSMAAKAAGVLTRHSRANAPRRMFGGSLEEIDKNFLAFFLVKTYIYITFNNLTSVEPGDFDYEYYEDMGILLLSTLKVAKNDYKALINMLYANYSTGVWGQLLDDKMGNTYYEMCITQAAYNNATHALGLMSADLEGLRLDADERKYEDNILFEFNKAKNFYARSKFDTRFQDIAKKLLAELNSPYTEMARSSNFSKLRIATGRPVSAASPERELPAASVFGGKTRRNRKNRTRRNKKYKTRRYSSSR